MKTYTVGRPDPYHYMDPDPLLDTLKNIIFRDDKWPIDEDFLKELRRRGFIL